MIASTSPKAPAERLRANAWGRYYVSNECNGCGLCTYLRPSTSRRRWTALLRVAPQPHGEKEASVRTRRRSCPLHCIHDDGDR